MDLSSEEDDQQPEALDERTSSSAQRTSKLRSRSIEERGPANAPRRGRRAIPEKWTRVISIHGDDLTALKTYDLGPELLLDASLSGAEHARQTSLPRSRDGTAGQH